jgi:HK97 family phage prohead protease
MQTKDINGHWNDRRFVEAEMKTLQQAGHFSGYASVFGIVDHHADIVMPGAFRSSLASIDDATRLPILWQHDAHQQIGSATVLREDHTGLYLEDQLQLYHEKALIAYQAIKNGQMKSLSIGYQVRSCYEDASTGQRYLQSLSLREISLVEAPANPFATILSVKEHRVDIAAFDHSFQRAISALRV